MPQKHVGTMSGALATNEEGSTPMEWSSRTSERSPLQYLRLCSVETEIGRLNTVFRTYSDDGASSLTPLGCVCPTASIEEDGHC